MQPSRDHGCQRRLRRLAGGVRDGGNFDGRKANFTPIVEQEASTIRDLDNTSFGCCIGAAVEQRIISAGGNGRTRHDERNNHWGPPRHTGDETGGIGRNWGAQPYHAGRAVMSVDNAGACGLRARLLKSGQTTRHGETER